VGGDALDAGADLGATAVGVGFEEEDPSPGTSGGRI
jgi:hypothetical protein